MSDPRGDPLARRAAALLRSEPVDEKAIERVIAAVRENGAPSTTDLTTPDVTADLVAPAGAEPREMHTAIDPARAPASRARRFVLHGWPALAAAVLIFALGLGAGALLRSPSAPPGVTAASDRGPAARVVADDAASAGAEPRLIEFVLVAPRAAHVSLVGEFNGWDASATPMRHTERGDGTWSVSVPLGAGRHVYAFVIDDSTWVPDPQAPLAPERWYGERNSVVVVPGGPRT